MMNYLPSLICLIYFLCSLGGNYALECNVPTDTWTTLTFRDLTQNGVIYSTCLTAPPGGRWYLQPTVKHLKLPPLAELMVYRDGDALLIHRSCSVDCSASKHTDATTPGNQSAPGDLLSDVQNLQLSLEREIINSEKFLASNEKIEERYKRSDFVSSQPASKWKRSDLKFEVKVDRKNIEKMTRLKKFASGKHSSKTLDSVENVGGCSLCPSFKQYKLIELHLRLPRGLECNNTGHCASHPDLLVSIEMKEKELECDEGESAILPIFNTETKCTFSSASLPSPSCLVATCKPTEGLVPIPVNSQKHTRHKANLKKVIGKRKRKAKFLESTSGIATSTMNEFKITLLSTREPKLCFWQLDTTSQKNLELQIPLVLLPHVNVYDGSLLNPKWKVEFCPVSNSSSFWLQATEEKVYIVYSNPYSLEKEATMRLSLHEGPCNPPPAVHRAKHWWESSAEGGRAVYSCAPELSMAGDAEVLCDAAGHWGTPPTCPVTPHNKSGPMSDDPDSTTEPSLDEAVWLANISSAHTDDVTNKSAEVSSAPGRAAATTSFVGNTSSATDASSLLSPSGTAGQNSPDSDTPLFDDYYDEVDDDYYSYNETEYEYLPEFNATAFVPNLPTSNSTSGNGSTVLFPTQTTEDIWGNYNDVDDVTDVRALLKALSIDEDAIMYLVGGCCALVVLLLVLTIVTCIVVRRRRYPDRVALGRKFDTFQNPIYEKTVVSVPIEGEIEDDEKCPPSTPPLAIKAEMEDLSDSTVMEQ